MKKRCLFLGFLVSTFIVNAQNPFEDYGFDVEYVTMTQGEFNESHDEIAIVEIGDVLFDTKNNKILMGSDDNLLADHINPEVTSRFISMDPHAERYYSISPYAYCANNPIRFIDPDGRDIVITGNQDQEALNQLQQRVGDRMTLSMDENGNVSYTQNTKRLRGDAKKVAKMIDDSSISVNVATRDKDQTSTGNLMIGGAFMGNNVSVDENGNVTVKAFQEVNPSVLGAADEHTRTPGKMMMHEVSEAYEGAKISQKSGVSSPNSLGKGSVYQQAHDRATPQTPVTETYYDASGRRVNTPAEATSVRWSVTRGTSTRVIQTYPWR